MAAVLLATILAVLQGLWPAPLGAAPLGLHQETALVQPSGATEARAALETRLAQWPAWRLPAPLARPGQGELVYPEWFAGDWLLRSEPWPETAGDDPAVPGAARAPAGSFEAPLRFRRGGRGAVLGERAANAMAVGRAVLGEALLEVRDDPADPNHQQARLRGGQWLDSTVIGRASAQPAAASFLVDELALQVLHSDGPPRLSRVETLSRYHFHPASAAGEGPRPGAGEMGKGEWIEGEWIQGEQWQVRHPGPGEIGVEPVASGHERLVLIRPVPAAPPADRAS